MPRPCTHRFPADIRRTTVAPLEDIKVKAPANTSSPAHSSPHLWLYSTEGRNGVPTPPLRKLPLQEFNAVAPGVLVGQEANDRQCDRQARGSLVVFVARG